MRQEASWHVLWGVTCSLREPTLFLAPSASRRWHCRILFECLRLLQQGGRGAHELSIDY